MADLLSIAGNAVKTNQSSLAIIGNNIANANTDGYVRQELDIRENLPTRAGTVFLGTGALSAGVKRAYDSLVESSLRSSLSDLRSQAPIIDYTNRVVDMLGDENSSLTSALDNFFASFRDLGLDASSELRRNSVISESKGLAGRLNEIATQLRSIDSDTLNALKFKVTEINSLVEQLSVVNGKLSRQSNLESQPPDLLNTRDQLLQNVAGLIKIRVMEESNGEVTVRLGDDSDGLVLLTKGTTAQIGLQYRDNSQPVGVDLILDPHGTPQNLNGISSGEIGGYLSFRDTTLKTAIEQVNGLATVIANEVNGMLAKGMDLYGASGDALFEIKPELITNVSFARSNISVDATISSIDSKNSHALEMIFDQANQRWIVTDLATNQTFAASNVNNFIINGINISISGQPIDGDIVTISSQESQASNIRVVIDDAKKLAVGELLGLTLGSENTGDTQASVSAVVPALGLNGVNMQEVLVNNLHESSAKNFQTSSLDPSFVIAAGTTDLNLSSLSTNSSGAELQVFTREGIHLFGTGNLSQSDLSAMLIAKNGFEATSSYSNSYLNGNGTYLDYQWSLGASGKSLVEISGDGTGQVTMEAKIISQSLPKTQNGTGQTSTLIAADALSLNGKKLSALQLAAGATLNASTVVNWLNTNISQNSLSLTASAENIITVPQNQIDLTSNALSINGTSITISAPMANLGALVNAINASTGSTDVFAEIDPNQRLTLRNKSGNEANTITFGSSVGALSITGDVRAKIKVEANRAANDVSDKSVTLTRNASSASTDLGILGFRETLSLNGSTNEDLIVFTTGANNKSLDYFAGYKDSSVNPLYQRDRTTDVKFTGLTSYQIVDRETNTVLSERTWSLGSSINYGAISLSIEGQPNVGDVFSIDGNQSGVGSNENALRIANLEDANIVGNGNTLKESYLSILTEAGNSARRSSVAQEALDVVYQQTVETKDAKAGVNLDEEAADLLRFQQAYQASARVMQMASQLFDSILRI